MAEQSIFVISLDFELHWGRFDKADPLGTKKYYQNTQKTLPKILAMFEKHKIEATWAAVGMLLAENKKEWKSYLPSLKPGYHNPNLSAYNWYDKRRIYKKSLFAPDLVRKILATPGQDLGSHTFAHYYTMEPGQTQQEFAADLAAAQRIATEKFNCPPKVLVFPRNQSNPSYLSLCKEAGFEAVRCNPANWFWQDTHNETLMKKIFRTADTLFPAGKRTSYPLSQLKFKDGFPIEIPSSRLLRPSSLRNKMVNQVKIYRIKREMSLAADKGEVYHLWWHPHNFGHHPKQNLQDLQKILEHFSHLNKTKGMVSKNMLGLADMVR